MNPHDRLKARWQCIAIWKQPFQESRGHLQLSRAFMIAKRESALAFMAGKLTMSGILHADAEAIRMEMTSAGGAEL